MQKLFNAMSVASFAMSAGLLIGTVALYTKIPSLTKHYIGELKSELTDMVTEMLPVQIEEVVPELPTKTGLPIPLP